MAKSAVQGVICDAELLVQTPRTENGNSGGVTVDRPGLPNEPQVKVEHARGVSECGDNFPLDRNSMLIDLVIEGFTEGNHVALILSFDTAIVFLSAEPEFHVIEEVEAGPVDKLVAGGIIFRPEEDGGSEDTFESVFDSAVVEAIGLEAEEGEHLGGALKADDPAFLFQGERCNPNGDEPVLTEGQTVVGVAEYLKEKFAAVPRVCQLIFQWAAQGQTAQNEWPGVERKFLPAAHSLFTNQADGFYLLESPLGDAKSREDFADLRYGRVGQPLQMMLSRASTNGRRFDGCEHRQTVGRTDRNASRRSPVTVPKMY